MKWNLSFPANNDQSASPSSKAPEFIAQIVSSSPTPALTNTMIPPPSISDVFNYISNRANGGLKLDVCCEETADVEQDFATFKYSLYSSCQTCTQSNEHLLRFARELDLLLEAIVQGYTFLRVYYPDSMQDDLVWVLNNNRREQADFFHACADLLQAASTTPSHDNGELLPLLLPRFQEFFFKMLNMFESRQVWEALRFGLHLVSPGVTASFVYRDLPAFYPLSTFVDFFLRVQTESEQATRVLALNALQLAEKFTVADRWENILADAEVLSAFCSFFSKPTAASSRVEDLSLFLRAERGRLVPPTTTSASWFGLVPIHKQVLEDIAHLFFANRVSEYRKATHDFLHKFFFLMNRESADVYAMIKGAVDALYSIKIGTLAYGDLDWLLFHLQHCRHCYSHNPPGSSARGSGGGGVAVSHVIARYLLSEELLRSKVLAAATAAAVADDEVVANKTASPPSKQQQASVARESRQFSSLLEEMDVEGKPKQQQTTIAASPQFVEEWTTARPTACIVRLPAACFDFIANGTLIPVLLAAANKTAGGVAIDIVRAGKIAVAPSAFRIQAKTKEHTQAVVKQFKAAVLNLGLCEARFKVSHRAYSQIVGRNGERIASIREGTGCKVYLSALSPASDQWNLVTLFGLAEHVALAHAQIKRFANDEHQAPKVALPAASATITTPRKPRQQPSPPISPVTTASGVAQNRKPPPDDVLFKAVQRRDWAVANVLIERDEGVHFVAASGTTVLHKAAERNAPDAIIQALIARGLDVTQTVHDRTHNALHFAIKNNVRASALEIILAAGADANARGENGARPVHLLIKRNAHPRLLQILIQYGADLRLADEETGQTALDLARALGPNAVAPELLALLEANMPPLPLSSSFVND